MGQPWSEEEVRAAIKGYFALFRAQEDGKPTNKTALYRSLSNQFPHRSAKAFELKFQNISAVLYEERYPFVHGLMPRSNYQNLLKLMVWDHLKRIGPPRQMPWEILVDNLRRLYARGFLPIPFRGPGRFGLTLEHHLGIPRNSSKEPDFMGIELKTKHDSPLHTLFSRTPSRFVGCSDRGELLRRFGRPDGTQRKIALRTSFGRQSDSFGFYLQSSDSSIKVRNGNTTVLEYSHEHLEEALLSKHSETAYLEVVSQENEGETHCRFEEMLYCKWPSILRFLKLVERGKVNLDFTLSMEGERVKDHGTLWRVKSDALEDLYLSARAIQLGKESGFTLKS